MKTLSAVSREVLLRQSWSSRLLFWSMMRSKAEHESTYGWSRSKLISLCNIQGSTQIWAHLPSAQLRSVSQVPERITSTHFRSKSYRYPQVNTGLTSKLQQVIYYAISTSPSQMFPLTLPLFLLYLWWRVLQHLQSWALPRSLISKYVAEFVDKGNVNDWMANSALADGLKRGSFKIFWYHLL
jgi:hypothetical protein